MTLPSPLRSSTPWTRLALLGALLAGAACNSDPAAAAGALGGAKTAPVQTNVKGFEDDLSKPTIKPTTNVKGFEDDLSKPTIKPTTNVQGFEDDLSKPTIKPTVGPSTAPIEGTKKLEGL